MSGKVKIILIVILILSLIGIILGLNYKSFFTEKKQTKQVVAEKINKMEVEEAKTEKKEEKETIVVIINNKKEKTKKKKEDKKQENEENKEVEEENNINNQEVNTTQNETTNNTESTVTQQQVNTPEYYIKVNYGANVINVYSKDENGNYTVPCKAFICSTGRATPRSGAYNTDYKYRWVNLFGNVYGQYATRIVGNILFHSVPYLEKGNLASLEYWEYDKLRNGSFYGMYKNDCSRCKMDI